MRAASVLLTLLLAAAPAAAQDLPALYEVTGVAADDVLNVRAAPDAGSEALGALAPDATDVEVVALSADRGWGQVNLSGEASGWASMRFLSPQEGPPWWEASVPLSCLGTEPFWSLGIEGESARWVTPEESPAPWAIDERTTTIGVPGILGLALENGFGVIRPAECSDGMSDRAFGLQIDLFLHEGQGLTGYTGCCSLR
jgi:uncharacterized membrane protein